jgi:hypothetical protein
MQKIHLGALMAAAVFFIVYNRNQKFEMTRLSLTENRKRARPT